MYRDCSRVQFFTQLAGWALLFFAVGIFAALPVTAEPSRKDAQIHLIAKEATKQAIILRKLAPLDEVRTQITNKSEVQQYIKERFKETDAQHEFMVLAQTLHLLGVFEADLPLHEIMSEVLEEQIAGYYDWEKKTLFVADWLPSILQKPTLIHEVTHALQDQHFNLGRFLVPMEGYGDVLGALQCLFEGDATLVMLDAMVVELGMSEGITPALENMLVRLLESGMVGEISRASGLEKVPPIIQNMLIFPYLGGLKMVLAARREGGWSAVDDLYRNLPLSTEQILHPEKLIGTHRDNPQDTRFSLPPSLVKSEWQEVGSDNLGEFGLREVLAFHHGNERAKEDAMGWDGDRFTLIRQGAKGPYALLWVSEWDSPAEAKQGLKALQEMQTPPAGTHQKKSRVTAVWGSALPNPSKLAKTLSAEARSDEISSFDMVLQRGSKNRL